MGKDVSPLWAPLFFTHNKHGTKKGFDSQGVQSTRSKTAVILSKAELVCRQ